MQSAMDVLVLEDFVLYKSEQPLGLIPCPTLEAEVAEPAVAEQVGTHVLGSSP